LPTNRFKKIMPDLQLRTFNNTQTGNIAEMTIDGSEACVYYVERCTHGVVNAGQDHQELFWATWTTNEGIPYENAAINQPCLDSALRELESILGDELTTFIPWHPETTGY
jgi:hypothetical protein